MILLFFLTLLPSVVTGQTCYHPDGSQAMYENTADAHIADIPCNASDPGGSACCIPGDACTTTGLCVGHAGWYYRGGCTDASWSTNACINIICKDGIILRHHLLAFAKIGL